MKLIVGLGNPGKEYLNTRHNVGFRVIDNYLSGNTNYKEKFNGLFLDLIVNDQKVIFLKPQSYMNLSGTVVKRFVDFYKIDINDILIISDDLDLNIGNFKLKSKGSSGGHNGLKNIGECLSSTEYKRLKIGISNNKLGDTKDYVLGKFSKEEDKILEDVINISKEIIDDYLKISFMELMSKYNQKNR